MEPASPPEFSIIIPCYNDGKWLLEAVESVRTCTQIPLEIIIVNDGSTEGETLRVFEILESGGQKVIHQGNLGLAAARNRAIREASAPYILPLDSDNRIRLRYLSCARTIFSKQSEISVVYSDVQLFGETNEIRRVEDFDINLLLGGNFIDACAVFRRSVWLECGGYDEQMQFHGGQGWEDWDFWLRLALAGKQFFHLHEIGFDYRIRSDSMLRVSTDKPAARSSLWTYMFRKHPEAFSKRYTEIEPFYRLHDEKAMQSPAKLFKLFGRSCIRALRKRFD